MRMMSTVVLIGVRLCPHRAEETPAHRQVQEQVARLDRSARGMGRSRCLDHLPGEDPYAGAEGIFRAATSGRERHGRDGPDSVQGLAAETQRDYAGEVVGRTDLA